MYKRKAYSAVSILFSGDSQDNMSIKMQPKQKLEVYIFEQIK